jgi:hypothetical protein
MYIVHMLTIIMILESKHYYWKMVGFGLNFLCFFFLISMSSSFLNYRSSMGELVFHAYINGDMVSWF